MTSPSLHMAFITDGEPFHGASPEQQALGGSETALVQAARALAQRGHRVQVFCRCPQPGLYQGVIYRDRRDLVQACPEERFDVVIVSRYFVALDLPLQSGLKVLWNHDILAKASPLGQRLDQLDLAFVLSDFHAQDYAGKLPALASKLAVTRNGLDLALLAQARRGVARLPGRLTYVSRPERGLKLLLKQIWPRLRQTLPHLTLNICGYQVQDTPLNGRWHQEQREIEELLAQSPGVEVLGPLAKADYYALLASCEALLYPCVFPEISCLAVLEAQAQATPLVTSDAFALRESVYEPWFRVGGAPGSPAYVEAFVQRALEVLGDPAHAQELARAAQARVQERHDWAGIVAEWEQLFLDWLEERTTSQAQDLAASLVMNGDCQAAECLLERPLPLPEEGPAPQDPDEEGLLGEMSRIAWRVLAGAGRQARVGVISADLGRTAQSLGGLLAPTPVEEIDGQAPEDPGYALVVVRDRLERAVDPALLLKEALACCAPEGQVLLCLASGAWPLMGPGFLARRHDLGREEILGLLPGRRVEISFLPRGLVHLGPARYMVGRWLALAPAEGPALGGVDGQVCLRRTRPAPPELLEEVRRAGLL